MIKRFPEYDFKQDKVSVGRNLIHDYPAMLHPKVVNSLIREISRKDFVIYDPFCGSGTTLVESLLENYNVIGTDINPLSLLIAKVRCSSINSKKVIESLSDFETKFKSLDVDIPEIKNVDWYFTILIIFCFLYVYISFE